MEEVAQFKEHRKHVCRVTERIAHYARGCDSRGLDSPNRRMPTFVIGGVSSKGPGGQVAYNGTTTLLGQEVLPLTSGEGGIIYDEPSGLTKFKFM